MAPLFTEDGEYLGRVYDLRSAGEAEHGQSQSSRLVTEVMYGIGGLLEALGFRSIKVKSLPWSDVRKFEDGKLIVASKYDMNETLEPR